MDLSNFLFDPDKENGFTSPINIESSIYDSTVMSRIPLITPQCKLINIPKDFGGYHEFKVWVPEVDHMKSRSGTLCAYRVINTDKSQKVYVSRLRSWPINIAFKPSVTPLDLCLRITPLFTCADRSSDVVEKCKKHEPRVVGSHNLTLKDKSFVEVVSTCADYVLGSSIPCCSKDQITVCIPLDVTHLLQHSKVESTPSCGLPGNSQSILLPEVQATIQCRVSCFNSCLGSHSRGSIEFVLTLESKRCTELGDIHHEIVGLRRINVRCCSCPSRDSRGPEGDIAYESCFNDSLRNVKPDFDISQNKRSSKRLSLNLSCRRNVRLGHEYGRQSCPQSFQNPNQTPVPVSEPFPSCSHSVTINGQNYYLTVTDSLDVMRVLHKLRNSDCLVSGRWKVREPSKTLTKIEHFYGQIENYIADRIPVTFMETSQDGLFSQTSQTTSETSSWRSTADKAVGTEDLMNS